MPIWKSRKTPQDVERTLEQGIGARPQKISFQRDTGRARSGKQL